MAFAGARVDIAVTIVRSLDLRTAAKRAGKRSDIDSRKYNRWRKQKTRPENAGDIVFHTGRRGRETLRYCFPKNQ
jgi:hypothetical protein